MKLKKKHWIILSVITVLAAACVILSFTTPKKSDFEAVLPADFVALEVVKDSVPVYSNYGFISQYSYTKKISNTAVSRVTLVGFAGAIYQADYNPALMFVNNCMVWLPSLLEGAGLTVCLTVVSVCIGIILSVVLALGKMSHVPVWKQFCQAYIFFFRGTPLLMQLYFVWFGLPLLNSDWTLKNKFIAAAIAFSLNCGAYCAEYVRAAIESIDKGQFEAAKVLGFSYAKTMTMIIIPQSYKRVIPSFANEFIMVLKDASITSIIAMQDLSKSTQSILTSTNQVSVYIPAMALYLIMTGVCTKVFDYLEKKFSIYE